jgi:WD40 repeat protein
VILEKTSVRCSNLLISLSCLDSAITASMQTSLSSLEGISFSQLGQFFVAPGSRIPPGACNSEKDLVILVQRGESRDTLSLWRLQGTKRWEIDVIANHAMTGRVRSVTWSPDGTPIVCLVHVKLKLTELEAQETDSRSELTLGW